MSKTFALVGDYKVAQSLGGAALVDSYIVESLRRRGYCIDYFAVNQKSSDWHYFRSRKYAGVLYTNLSGMNIEQLEWVCTEGPPYILFRHDIPTIVYQIANASSGLQSVFKRLFSNARCTVFISNLQRHKYQEAIPLGPSTVVPPPINFPGFMNVGSVRREGFLYLGPVCEIRGLRKSIDYWRSTDPEAVFDAHGRVEDAALAEFAEKLGVRIFPPPARSDIPKLMSRYSTLVHHPNFIDSFCIKIIEAEICGMSLAVDRERIGRFSYAIDAQSLAAHMEEVSCNRLAKIIDAFL